MLSKSVINSDFEKFEDLGGMECVKCGCCSYICPAKIPLTHLITIGKAAVKQALDEKAAKGGVTNV